jgi:hypothetical protein
MSEGEGGLRQQRKSEGEEGGEPPAALEARS